MATDILSNYNEATVTTTLNNTDAAGTSDNITVSSVLSSWTGLSAVQQMRVMDKADLASTSGYEIMTLTADNGGSAGTWTLTRGSEGSTVKAHAANWTLVPATTAGGLGNAFAPLGAGSLTLISRQVLSVAAATVTFSSIPGTYENLRFEIMGRLSDANNLDHVKLQFNGDTGAHYDHNDLEFTNGATATGANVGDTSIGLGYLPDSAASPSGMAGFIEATIAGYARTTFFKALSGLCISHWNNSGNSALQSAVVFGLWESTTAITSLSLTDAGGGNFIVGSVFSLYGES